ncbi:MAG: hypothetical protein JWM36_3279 [Hyphomicrobiales bacterium]|nr:hypothetical protein [Hyphomicrobiales bacterium]
MSGWQVRVITAPNMEEVFAVNISVEAEAVEFIKQTRDANVEVVADGPLTHQTLSFMGVPLGGAKSIL